MIFRQGRFPGDMEYEITIDLDNMTITFQRPRGGEGLLAGLLRRLSIASYVTWPYESMFTNWKWYWKDNGNVWRLYDKDHLVSLLRLKYLKTLPKRILPPLQFSGEWRMSPTYPLSG